MFQADALLSSVMELANCPPSSACYCAGRLAVLLATSAEVLAGTVVMSHMTTPMT